MAGGLADDTVAAATAEVVTADACTVESAVGESETGDTEKKKQFLRNVVVSGVACSTTVFQHELKRGCAELAQRKDELA